MAGDTQVQPPVQQVPYDNEYRRALDAITDYAILTLDVSGVITGWNAGAQRITGFAPEEMLGRPYLAVYPPDKDASAEAQNALETAHREGRAVDVGWRARRDGSRFPGETIVSALHDDPGATCAFVAVMRDLTVRSKTPADLVQPADQTYRLLVDSVKDYAIFMLDANGVIASWNEGAERINGYTEAEAIGRDFSILYPEESVASRQPWKELESAADGRFEEEGWRVRKDGARYWASVVTTPLRVSGGQLVGFAQIIRDLTERKAAEEELRLSEERYRLLVGGVKDYAIFMLDENGYVLTWNEGARRIKGYSGPDIIGRHFSDFYPQAAIDARWPWKELEFAAAEGRFEDEGWRVRKDGSLFWANVIITALRGRDGRLYGYSKVTRDMTDRRLAEEKIRSLNEQLQARVDELAASNREVAQKSAENEAFVYSVSHDVRAPLVNLQGFSHEMKYAADELRTLLADQAIPSGTREQAARIIETGIVDSVRHVQAAVTHLSNIVDGLLRLSRAGRIVYQFVNVRVRDIVDRIITAQNAILTAHGAEITVDDLPCVAGDPVALEQLFSNLISNALNYLDPARKGRIHIGAATPRDGYEILFVRDNGAGLSESAQAKLFQVFQRFHPHLGPGEGMGLAIAHRIVERHNGKIWAESVAGEGTTFFVALPQVQPETLSQ